MQPSRFPLQRKIPVMEQNYDQDEVSQLRRQMAEMHDQMKQMTEAMTQQQQLLQNAGIQTTGTLSAKPKFKVAQPESFGGRRDRTSLEDWLFKLRQYFEIKEMDGSIRVQFATTLLTEDAAIWW